MQPVMPSLPTFKLDRQRHAAPQVFEHLREMIVRLDLPPGTVLSRVELAEAFGLSQTPVRDALIKLGEEGLVDIFPQHATVVSRISLSVARQSHFLRRALELEALATLCEATEAALLERLLPVLRRLIEQQRVAAAAVDTEHFVALDRAFHQQILQAAGAAELGELVHQRNGHVDRLRRLHLPVAGKMAQILTDHLRITDALAARDAAACQAALRQHLGGTLRHADEIRERHPQYVGD